MILTYNFVITVLFIVCNKTISQQICRKCKLVSASVKETENVKLQKIRHCKHSEFVFFS